MARFFLTIYALVLGMTVAWAGAGHNPAKPTGESPPPVTLRTVITGTCQEVQRYAESVLGAGMVRSVAEVQRGDAPLPPPPPLPANTLFLPAPGSGFTLTSSL